LVLAVQRIVFLSAGPHGISTFTQVAFNMLLFINLMWPLVNLLPIWPLDGGQISRELFQIWLPGTRGIRASLILALVVAAACALFILIGDRFFEPLQEWI